jgi:alcohol dehydrogenase
VVGGWGRSIALYAVAIARALGAGRIDYIDTDRERLAIAERLGARGVEGPPPRRAGSFPITVDASADPAGLACALRSVEPYGVCTAVAIYFVETSLPLLEMYTRGVRFVTGRVNARAVIPEELALVQAGRLHPEVVNSALVPWEDAHEVILADQRKPVFVRDLPASR